VAYKLEEVARSICSSKALLAEDPNHPAMVMQLFRCMRCECRIC